jgi:hypothetical protein
MSTTMSATHERITQACPGCGRLLRIPPEMKGMQVQCKFCDHAVTVGQIEELAPERGLTHVGSGTAFQIEKTLTSAIDKESRFTVVRHPSKQALRGYTLAIDCHGPARVNVAGIRASDGQAMSLGKVRPQDVRIIPLDDVTQAYLWLDRAATATVKMIVTRIG